MHEQRAEEQQDWSEVAAWDDAVEQRAAELVGSHDRVVLNGPRLGVWVECECGWIGPSRWTEAAARETHAAHQEHVRREVQRKAGGSWRA